MGNGTGLTLDTLEKAAQAAAASFGKPSIMMMPAAIWSNMYTPHPEFSPLQWANTSHMSQRELKMAALHSFLFKLDCLKNMEEVDHIQFYNTAVKRLKRAKWARYGKRKKVQSSP